VTVFSAIAPGTDLSQHARALARVHDAVLGGARPPMRPRALVARSWSRVMRSGLDPSGGARRATLPPAELERRRRESPLALIIDELRQVLSSAACASSFLLVVTDADGVILWREGAPGLLLRADALGFAEATVWTEERVGTNAIGTALAEAAPVQLFSAEHYEQGQHPWYCTASPVHDPRTGELLGVVDVSGPALTLHPVIAALVETAVRLGEARLRHYHQERLSQLRRSTEHVLATVDGPVLVVDDHGWVASHAGVAGRDRIAAPRADQSLAVPGLGLCLPERLADGWLVRPRAAGRALVAELELGGRPVLELLGGAQPWRTALTPRHAEMLVALDRAGPAGVTAAQLSTAMYGDAAHTVTVRAEISRLRRVIGALVETSPYRLAEGVRLVVRQAGAPASG
jgi:hypothetical protein